jgi:hypothetical protein
VSAFEILGAKQNYADCVPSREFGKVNDKSLERIHMPQAKTTTAGTATSEMAILGRVLSNGKDFTPALARHMLGLGFSVEDNARINDLAGRNQQGALTPSEREELLGFANAGCLLGILHAKARRALKKVGKK